MRQEVEKAGDDAMEENDLRDLESIVAHVETLEWKESGSIDSGISSFWQSMEFCAEQKDGWPSRNSGKRTSPFFRSCSLCHIGFLPMRCLVGSLPSSIRNSVKPVLCSKCREPAQRWREWGHRWQDLAARS